MTKKIGILTGGGDCGGLNAAIEAVVKSASNERWEVYGIRAGWEGLILDKIHPLHFFGVDRIHPKTGTILQTSRTNPYNFTGTLNGQDLKQADVSGQVIETAKNHGLEAIIACGGNDTLSVIPKLKEDYGSDIIFIGLPKTMDGDLQTYSLGLDTAINKARESLEEFVPILSSNRSIGIVELFGRDVGRVTFKAGIAAGADAILIPEVPIDIDYTCNFIAGRYDHRAKQNGELPYILIAVAEGTEHPLTGNKVYQEKGKDAFGNGKLGGISEVLAKLIEDRLKDDSRITAHTPRIDIKPKIPTYEIRGGDTLSSDSYFGQKLGTAAVQYLKNGVESGMAVVNFNENGQIELMPIQELIKPRPVHSEVLNLFERSGSYCFGRRPLGQEYKPISTISSN
ncbi:MAG: 6-phosphofructokinase [Candidatus Woesearchaeota archaeon]